MLGGFRSFTSRRYDQRFVIAPSEVASALMRPMQAFLLRVVRKSASAWSSALWTAVKLQS
jgi:hypothetical protein